MEYGQPCPGCGTERAAADGSRPGPGAPTCDCAHRAAEAHHAERIAATADAEDFNPLRIRPYVNLAGPDDDAAEPAGDAAGKGREEDSSTQRPHPGAPPSGGGSPAADPAHTMPLRAIPASRGTRPPVPHPHATQPHGTRPQPHPQPHATQPLPLAHPHPHAEQPYDREAPHSRAPLAEPPPPGTPPPGTPHTEASALPHNRPRRSRPAVLLATAAAVAVLTGTAFAVGAFDADTETPRALPTGGAPAPAAAPVTEPVPTPSHSGSASAAAAASSPSATSARTSRPSPTRATRSATAPASRPTPPVPNSPRPSATTPVAPPTRPEPPVNSRPPGSLTEGSTGPAVAELQERLSQVWLYRGPHDGRYTSNVTSAVASYQSRMGVEGDPKGVYGPATRSSLETFTYVR